MGSGELIRSLMAAGQIDEYLLMIHPVVLGTGHQLFASTSRAALRLVEAEPTATGVIVALYTPDRR
jgi:dihydrofolate reductase